jgi:hypothetical protein
VHVDVISVYVRVFGSFDHSDLHLYVGGIYKTSSTTIRNYHPPIRTLVSFADPAKSKSLYLIPHNKVSDGFVNPVRERRRVSSATHQVEHTKLDEITALSTSRGHEANVAGKEKTEGQEANSSACRGPSTRRGNRAATRWHAASDWRRIGSRNCCTVRLDP